jgi:hypothetical protein
MAGLFAGCTRAAQRQYQTAITDLSSERCRALQAVVEGRERYGIVAPSRDLDEDVLRRCRLPYSSGGGPPFQQTQLGPSVPGPEEVQIERRDDTYRVPVRINGTITLPFLLDTGGLVKVNAVEIVHQHERYSLRLRIAPDARRDVLAIECRLLTSAHHRSGL